MQLPEAVGTYFDADKSEQLDVLIDAFAERAVVKDEGKTYEGHDEIRGWWRHAKNKYHHVAEPISMIDEPSALAVRAKVTGDFPGSPAILKFSFALAEGKIERLEIG
jgi:hypothetical protein